MEPQQTPTCIYKERIKKEAFVGNGAFGASVRASAEARGADMFMHICIYIWIYRYMHICMYLHTYVCIYIFFLMIAFITFKSSLVPLLEGL